MLHYSMASAATQGLHRGRKMEVLVSLGGLRDAGMRAKEIREEYPYLRIWLGGTVGEQKRFRDVYDPPGLIILPPSVSTLDEARKFIQKAVDEGITVIGVLDYELHAPRTIFTLVRQAREMQADVRFLPYIYIDRNRKEMFWALRELAVLIEAWKLWWYRVAKGDVASLQEVIEFYSD